MNTFIDFLKKTDTVEIEDSLSIFKQELTKTFKNTEEEVLSGIFSPVRYTTILENLLTHYLGKTVSGRRGVYSTYDCSVVLKISDNHLAIFTKYLMFVKEAYFTSLTFYDEPYSYLFLKNDTIPNRILKLASIGCPVDYYIFQHKEHEEIFKEHYRKSVSEPLFKKLSMLT